MKIPECPTHKRELVPTVFRAMQGSLMKGGTSGFECPVQDCQIKYAKTVADDAGGFFTLDSQGKPRPLP